MKLPFFIPAIGLLLLFSQCARPTLSHSNFTTFNMRLEIDSTVDKRVADELATRFTHFIAEYNMQNPAHFRLSNRADLSTTTLTIRVTKNKMVSEGEQFAGVVISAVGLSMPFMMASAGAANVFSFMYWPHDVSKLRLYLSQDISGMKRPFIRQTISNSGFFRSYDKQLLKHGDKFDDFLYKLLRQLERSYEKQSRKTRLSAGITQNPVYAP